MEQKQYKGEIAQNTYTCLYPSVSDDDGDAIIFKLPEKSHALTFNFLVCSALYVFAILDLR